jgi:hypothetical protein
MGAGGDWPRSRCAAEEGDKLAPFIDGNAQCRALRLSNFITPP